MPCMERILRRADTMRLRAAVHECIGSSRCASPLPAPWRLVALRFSAAQGAPVDAVARRSRAWNARCGGIVIGRYLTIRMFITRSNMTVLIVV